MPQVKHVEDHPIEDVFGSEILPGDLYWVFGDVVVSDLYLKTYLVEKQNVQCYRVI
ncbi:hypothetical protein MUB24_03300 [Lederbergia sp. NSJ-179]|uniref:hypothetical protein n=1 Tax=Lederbergia sp. NSJ-179 TaxID=2931402 RepID=UPI001FCFD01D|nr:hypothetical protein [Lederbergia sp. NSJ-179]MCJ7839953.1 hypothetical protein [Lederbergia sp. NSJ-179]